MTRNLDYSEELETRRALKRAVRKVILRLMREQGLTQIQMSGIADISRTTLREILNPHEKGGSFPRLDTLADIVCGLGIPPSRFMAMVAEELAAEERPFSESSSLGTLEIILNGQTVRAKLIPISD